MTEYIPRLREELVEAAARECAGRRHRRAIRPRRVALLAAAAAIVAAAVLAASAIKLPNDERPVTPASGTTALGYSIEPPGAAGAAAETLRTRVAAAGLDRTSVSAADGRIRVETTPAGRERVAELAAPGKLAIYDWEASVLIPRPSTKKAAMRRAAHLPGIRVVQADDGWYLVHDAPALGNASLAGAHATTDPSSGEPAVAIDLNAGGRAAFRTLTREVARRGAANARPGANPLDGSQHVAIVLDDRVLTLPFINYRENPDGVDGSSGLYIEGGLTPERARDIAAILSTGPLAAAIDR